MFFDTEINPRCHPLPHDPFRACVAPRPIGWISTLNSSGVPNLAPYSFFNAVAGRPPMVMYCSGGHHPHGPKDTVTNIEATGEFVVNVATWDLREAMNVTSQPVLADENEFELAGLTAAPSTRVKPPRVLESPINMECVLERIVDLPCTDPDGRNAMVIGRVVGMHIDEGVLTDGCVDAFKLRLIARLGYEDYAVIERTFAMARPLPGTRLGRRE